MFHPPLVPAANHLPGYRAEQGKGNDAPAESCQMSEMNHKRNRQMGEKQPGKRKFSE